MDFLLARRTKPDRVAIKGRSTACPDCPSTATTARSACVILSEISFENCCHVLHLSSPDCIASIKAHEEHISRKGRLVPKRFNADEHHPCAQSASTTNCHPWRSP